MSSTPMTPAQQQTQLQLIQRLKQYMSERQLKQMEVSQLTGISNTTLSQWLNQKYRTGYLTSVDARVADFLDNIDSYKQSPVTTPVVHTPVQPVQSSSSVNRVVTDKHAIENALYNAMLHKPVHSTTAQQYIQQKLQQFDRTESTQPDTVIPYCPLLIDVEYGDKHVSDTLLWNTQQHTLSIEQYVADLCSEYQLNNTLQTLILKNLYQQVNTYNTLFTTTNVAKYNESIHDKYVEIQIDLQHKSTHIIDTVILDLYTYNDNINTIITDYVKQLCTDWQLFNAGNMIQYTIYYQLYLDRKQLIGSNTTLLKRLDKQQFVTPGGVLRPVRDMRQYTTRVISTALPKTVQQPVLNAVPVTT